MSENKSFSKKSKIVIFWCALAVLLAAVAFLVYIMLNSYLFQEKPDVVEVSSVNTSSETLPDNPIDFAPLIEKNIDVYAWIKIPNTVIDYPVLQTTDKSDSFYLNHDIDGNYKFAGCIYSEKKNRTDFSDRNTVLYGHNMLNGTMFQNLHKFRDKSFFDENKYIYIYTPKHIFTYEIFAAYKYDNRHLLNSFNYSDDAVFQEYLDYIKNPTSMLVNRRDVDLNLESKILTLSTCIGNESNFRYLVQGVLISDERTK